MSESNVEYISWPECLIAFWDFRQAGPTFAPTIGRPGAGALRVVGGNPRKTANGPFGHALVFDGRSDALAVPVDQIGPLNVGASGDEVSVLAWVKRKPSSSCHFIAGIWVENDNAPKRQYGLFVDLPAYGGADRACGHISRSGGPSPGLPFSRDYSASHRGVPFHEWHLIGFTYDGEQAISYLDGTSDFFPEYTEPGPPLGIGLTYSKNPYRTPSGQDDAGLNNTPAEFTVGFVELTSGPGNHFAGSIGGVAVFDRALTDNQILGLAQATISLGASR